MNACIECGEALVFEYSDTSTVPEVIGNRVLIPRPIAEADVRFHALENVDLDVVEGVDPSGAVLLGWDPALCQVVPVKHPCPQVIEWDISLIESPADLADFDCPACDPATGYSQPTYYREIGAGCITHVCLNGVLECFGSPVSNPSTTEFICYDLSAWNFPTNYSAGAGSWVVYGIDRMIDACPSGTQEVVITSTPEWTADYPSGGGTGPSDWAALNWIVDTIDPTPGQARAIGQSDYGTYRPAFRFLQGFLPVGMTGPLELEYEVTAASGSISLALFDVINGITLPISLSSAPAGSNTFTSTGPQGTVGQMAPGVLGTYRWSFTMPAGTQAENLQLIVWNMGGGAGEAVEAISVTGEVSGGVGCLSFSSVSQVANYLNSNDPQGLTWTVDGTCLCAEAPIGVGANYGPFATIDETSTAAIGETPPCTS